MAELDLLRFEARRRVRRHGDVCELADLDRHLRSTALVECPPIPWGDEAPIALVAKLPPGSVPAYDLGLR